MLNGPDQQTTKTSAFIEADTFTDDQLIKWIWSAATFLLTMEAVRVCVCTQLFTEPWMAQEISLKVQQPAVRAGGQAKHLWFYL